MQRDIKKFTRGQYDVLIIGGGINGAAVAHMAALNGLKVALIEKEDFASGTSSKSTKLIHGGLRYLENMEIGLVRESLKERFVQLKNAPHLVHPLRFVVPVYKSDRRPLWMIKFGVWLYDVLSREYTIEKHHTLSAKEICQKIPGIQREGLIGGVEYSDAQMNDARLCLENILSAVDRGAHVINYAKARSFIYENGKTVGVQAYDTLGQEAFNIRAKRVVCAVGPWTNVFMQKETSQSPPPVRTTKGVHIVYKGCISNYAILIPARQDQRIFFVIPWMGNSLIGTTDTDFQEHPDSVEVKQEDVSYLINEARRVLPHADLKKENIIGTFAGLRPLVKRKGSPTKVSRKHITRESYSGLIYVIGGKYTTYRKIAEDVVGKLTKKPLIDTRKKFPVYGSGEIKESAGDMAGRYSISVDIVRYLMNFYGTRFRDILILVENDSSLKEPICTCSPVIRAQIVYAVEREMARTEEDIIVRRLALGYNDCQSNECRRTVHHMLMAMNI